MWGKIQPTRSGTNSLLQGMKEEGRVPWRRLFVPLSFLLWYGQSNKGFLIF